MRNRRTSATSLPSRPVTDTDRKTKFQVKRETTYRDLVDAGMRVFAEKGFAATRVDDIVERTGQTKGAFYFHFRNKLDLLGHISRHRDELRAGWHRLPESMDPATTTLADALFTTLAEIERRYDHVGPWILVMVDAFNQTRGVPEAEALFRSAYERWIDELTELVDILKTKGWATTTAPSREVAIQLFALGEGYAAHARLYGLRDDDAIGRAYTKLLTT